jgi:hypothetical protein
MAVKACAYDVPSRFRNSSMALIASDFSAHSGIRSSSAAQEVTTFGEAGLLCLIAFGSQTTRFSKSAFAIP